MRARRIWVAVSYMHARRPRPLRMCIACGPRIDACIIRRGRAHVRLHVHGEFNLLRPSRREKTVRDRDAYMRNMYIYLYIYIYIVNVNTYVNHDIVCIYIYICISCRHARTRIMFE